MLRKPPMYPRVLPAAKMIILMKRLKKVVIHGIKAGEATGRVKEEAEEEAAGMEAVGVRVRAGGAAVKEAVKEAAEEEEMGAEVEAGVRPREGGVVVRVVRVVVKAVKAGAHLQERMRKMVDGQAGERNLKGPR